MRCQGEIIYKDDEGAVCRLLELVVTAKGQLLTENTVNAFLIIESVDPSRKDDLEAAAASLAEDHPEISRRFN